MDALSSLAADGASAVASGVAGLLQHTTKVITGQAGTMFLGPAVVPPPLDLAHLDRGQTLGFALSTIRVVSVASRPKEFAPGAALAATVPLATHFRRGGWPLRETGLNPQRVLQRGEWSRLITSQLVSSDTPLAITTWCEVYGEIASLERRWGWPAAISAFAAVTFVGQALYVALTAAAYKLTPFSALARQYSTAFAVGPAPAALGLSVVAGYDADYHASSREGRISSRRFGWVGKLAAIICMGFIREAVGLAMNYCGLVAGVLVAYAAGGMGPERERRRAGLGWQDLALQGGLMAASGLIMYLTCYKPPEGSARAA